MLLLFLHTLKVCKSLRYYARKSVVPVRSHCVLCVFAVRACHACLRLMALLLWATTNPIVRATMPQRYSYHMHYSRHQQHEADTNICRNSDVDNEKRGNFSRLCLIKQQRDLLRTLIALIARPLNVTPCAQHSPLCLLLHRGTASERGRCGRESAIS
jgi:hypothetical protein